MDGAGEVIIEATGKMHKTSGYVRTVVAFHNLRDSAKEAVESLQERGVGERIHDGWSKARQDIVTRSRNYFTHPDDPPCEHIPQTYSYIFRPKSRWELVLLSGTVCGIEFCYSAETAFVTPVLLGLGLNIKFVTMIWCLSPLIGFFLTPVLGSMSDSCESKCGRRRPFIILYSIGILLGLILVPNGHYIGMSLGDTRNVLSNSKQFSNATSSSFTSNSSVYSHNMSVPEIDQPSIMRLVSKGNRDLPSTNQTGQHLQPWSIAFTVIGTVLLDFCSDACQSPSRTYLLDVSLPEDHTAGLSTFTMMAGFGGSIGYLMGAFQWESTILGSIFGEQVNVVFFIVTILFLVLLLLTVCNFPEIPLTLLKDPRVFKEYQQKLHIGDFKEKGKELDVLQNQCNGYGSTADEARQENQPNSETSNALLPVTTEIAPTVLINPVKDLPSPSSPGEAATLQEYLRSIVHQPWSLRILCLTNLFSWMSLVCYSLYFTDFVGEVVYRGDPQAPEGTPAFNLYKDGVRFGCWGMALYSISCSVYSYFIEALVKKFGARSVYIGGPLVYSLGMIIMATARHPVAVILLSPTAGVMYSTLFTMPYLLIAHYHCMQKFSDGKGASSEGVRGIGTDVASVSSMVFLSQFLLSLTMGSIVEAVGSNVATVCAAALLSACAALCASQVMYLDL